jgi:NDP-sugar pyrophosphorylase family protein
VNLFAARVFESLPDREVFSHLDDWLAPRLAAGASDICGEVLAPADCLWEPVGTPAEYLEANLRPQQLSYLDADARARASGTRLEAELVIGAGAALGRGVALERAVVWDGERVPDAFHGRNGIYAGGAFHEVADRREAP